ncbi:MAG: CobD/CbiB family cobalamin biosynthesis protein [Haloarculaceae archaeon]
MTLAAAGSVLAALLLDLAVAEFPGAVHPVALFGRLVAALDREWTHPRLAGAALALCLPLAAAGVVGSLAWGAGRVHPLLGAAVAALALFATTSLRRLLSAADAVVAASDDDLAAARDRLSALAGRDPAALSAAEVRSAAVESAAENLADGLVGPLLAFAVLATVSLPAAAAGAAWVKAVNTLDSMLGYPAVPHGTASARLDDLVMWLPARASAGLLALAAADPGALRRARPWAHAPTSPNSGWPMATLAAALGVRLAKPGHYVLDAGPALPDVTRAARGVRTVRTAGLLAFLGAAGVVWWS